MKVLHVAWGGESLTILLMWRADEPLRLSQMGPELGRRGSYSAKFGPPQSPRQQAISPIRAGGL